MTAPAFYRARLVKDGPWIGVLAWFGPPIDPDVGDELDRSWRWQALVDGESVEPNWHAGRIEDRAQFLAALGIRNIAAIDGDEYRYLAATRQWAASNDPDAPEANPRRRVDLRELPPILPPNP